MTVADDTTVGERDRRPRWSDVLRALREARGVTQEGWAAHLGVSRKTIARWESGERAPDPGAESALITYCRERNLFRAYERGPLAGLTLTPEHLQDLLAEARWRGGRSTAAPPAPSPASPASPVATTVPDATTAFSTEPVRAAPAVAPQSNLPTSLTSFVGREQEVAAVRRALGGARLLTLTGAGGSGKTRLALQVAAELLWAYPHGIWLVELAALTDPALVPRTVAAALSLPDAGARPPLEAIQEFVRPRNLLLVLDNCEHLLPACAALVESLLRAGPGLEVLATSREPLGIAGETVWPVPPMTVPATGVWLPLSAEGASALPDAVRLFVERARLQRPEFGLTPANAEAVADICRRLDGIPLALELAAAWVAMLSVDQIAARLNDRFRLLTRGNRTALPRQQTLRAAMDWSHDLLSEVERILLRRLAVFAGGFTLEAAEAVCADEAGHGEHAIRPEDILDLLARLVDTSLVLVEERDGTVRYRLLETVRAYAAERLEAAGETSAIRRRHVLWCLALAEAAEAHRNGPEQRDWLIQVAAEQDNIRAALDCCLTDPDGAALGLRLGAAVSWFWEVQTQFSEGRRWLIALLARRSNAPPQTQATALDAAAWFAREQGDHDEAVRLNEEALAIQRERGDDLGVARALSNLGILADMRNDREQAQALFEESLALRRRLGDRQAVAGSLINLGIFARRQGDTEQAVVRYEEGLAILREIGNTFLVATALLNLANARKDQGAWQPAAAHYHESLTLYRDLQNRIGAIRCIEGLAAIAVAHAAAEQAARLCGAAAALREELGVPLPPDGRAGFERTVAAIRAILDEAAFTAAWGAGEALSLEDACTEALAVPATT